MEFRCWVCGKSLGPESVDAALAGEGFEFSAPKSPAALFPEVMTQSYWVQPKAAGGTYVALVVHVCGHCSDTGARGPFMDRAIKALDAMAAFAQAWAPPEESPGPSPGDPLGSPA